MKFSITTFLLIIPILCFGGEMNKGKEDSQVLMESVLPLAEKLLSKNGEFFPYGGAMKPNGEIVGVAAYDGDEQPPSAELIKLLQQAYKTAAKNKEYKATALVYDVRVQLPESSVKTDAIAIALDHELGYSVVVFIPYNISNNHLSYGTIFAQAGENSVFE